MATFSDYLKNIFWILLILQFAPFFIRSIKQQYSDLLEQKTKVGIISIKGTLSEAGPSVRTIKKFFEDPTIKAVVLKVDSPGGLAGTAQTIFNEIIHYKNQSPNKYVVGLVENMAGSGGYYVASAAHYIIASPSAFIGSIGAYIQHPFFKDFIEQYKIKYDIIKTGTYKAAGNPLLELSPEQRKQFQSITDDVYRQFTRDVSRQRPQLSSDTTKWADGKIFTGDQALSLKLIDEVGSPATVRRVLKDNAHIEGKIEWVKPTKRQGFLAGLFKQDTEEDESSYIGSFVKTVCMAIEDHYRTGNVVA